MPDNLFYGTYLYKTQQIVSLLEEHEIKSEAPPDIISCIQLNSNQGTFVKLLNHRLGNAWS